MTEVLFQETEWTFKLYIGGRQGGFIYHSLIKSILNIIRRDLERRRRYNSLSSRVQYLYYSR